MKKRHAFAKVRRERAEGTRLSRRQVLKGTAAAGAGFWFLSRRSLREAFAQFVAQSTLDGATVDKFVAPMVIPPAMPRTTKVKVRGGKNIDYYEIAVRQFQQQILPNSFNSTTVWSYGSVQFPGTVGQGGTFNYPAFTIESKWNKPARVKWINDLGSTPHLLPVDPTLHWANPIGPPDTRPDPADATYWDDPDLDGTNGSYIGPVPMVTHVHGAHTTQESDGYPEAWYLSAGATANYTVGSFYAQYKAEFEAAWQDGFAAWAPGSAVFQYPNDMRACTLWYHDHTLGMTRLNVYAGPAGFYIIRGGPGDDVRDINGQAAVLPGPAPALGDPPGTAYYEIPIAIQDRSFTTGGQLWYPNYRAFFEGLGDTPEHLMIPFTPQTTLGGEYSDVAPIWQPEFFGDVMVVNGVSWPSLAVEARRYRFRFLNGCNSRFLILRFEDPSVPVSQIGAEGGFLAAPVDLTGGSLLMAPAERADVIVDFTGKAGTSIKLMNDGPDVPFAGAPIPAEDQPMSQMREVMRFDVGPIVGADATTPPAQLVLPAIVPLAAGSVRKVSLNEEESQVVLVPVNDDGEFVFDTNGTLWEVAEDESPIEVEGGYGIERLPDVIWDQTWTPGPFGPTAALLGTLDADGFPVPKLWMEPVTEDPAVGSTETWEIHNYTADAHPIHIHLVQFQVVGRGADGTTPPQPTENGFKDTVIAYPGEITKVIAKFDIPGRFVWHCHIVEHEDNEMMRPYDVV